MTGPTGDHISATITGDVHGQVAVGAHNTQTQALGDRAVERLADAELAELRRAFADLRAQVTAGAPPEQRDAALARVDELQDAITGEEPDPTTIELVRRWFVRHVPDLAGAVVSLVVHPLVGRLVTAAGDALLGDDRP